MEREKEGNNHHGLQIIKNWPVFMVFGKIGSIQF
jgi:hypothetical protein